MRGGQTGSEDSNTKPLHPIPFPLQVPEPLGEDKKKGKPEKLKRCIRTAAGSSWEDPSLLEWDAGKWAQVQSHIAQPWSGQALFLGAYTGKVNQVTARLPPLCRAGTVSTPRGGLAVALGAGLHPATEQHAPSDLFYS